MANIANKQLLQSQARAAGEEAKHGSCPSDGDAAVLELNESIAMARSTANKIGDGREPGPYHQPSAQQPCDGSAALEPETPLPVNRRDPLTLDSSCSSSDEEVSVERGRKRSLDFSRGSEAAALAVARARAAEEREAAAEEALAAAQDRAAAAEAANVELRAAAAEQAARIASLEEQLLQLQLRGSQSSAPHVDSGRGPAGQQLSEVDAAPSSSSGASATQHDDTKRTGAITEDDDENAEPMDLWPPPGLSGCELDFCADGDAAASAERAADLAERVAGLEADLDAQSEKLTAAFARMGAMCDMVRGAAKIAFSGNDLSARRMRHHIFQALDMDADGFLGEADLEHWYGVNRALLETGGFDAVSLEQVRHQICDALHDASLPPAFAKLGRVSMLQLTRSKMGAGVVSIMLNLDNLMQERSTAEWGANTIVSI